MLYLLLWRAVEFYIIIADAGHYSRGGSVDCLNTRERIMTIRLMEKLKARPENAKRLCRGKVHTGKTIVSAVTEEHSGAEAKENNTGEEI